MEHPTLILLLILALAVLAWWLVSHLISAALGDLLDILCPMRRLLDREEIDFTVKISIENDKEETPPSNHEKS